MYMIVRAVGEIVATNIITNNPIIILDNKKIYTNTKASVKIEIKLPPPSNLLKRISNAF
jgi:hypothetical protein